MTRSSHSGPYGATAVMPGAAPRTYSARKLAQALAVCFFSSCLAASQQQATQVDRLRIAEAVRVERAPRLDGTLNDPLWAVAKAVTDFVQREPREGQAPSERTEVRILYTRSSVYFGVRCSDSQPGGVVATQLRRDMSQELDDYFEVIIDSSRDRRNAYLFQVNPLGTQRDGLITEETRTEEGDGDPGWDGIWTSDARIQEGWTATIAIPFSTLNFMQSRDVVWGINFKRFIRRKNEEDLWSAWRRSFGVTKVSQAGELHGVSEIGSGRLFIIKPYLLGGFSHFPQSAASSGFQPGTTALHTAGVDVKLGLRSSLVANFTANTDFADADVDTQQFNLSPYKLFFPEKRQFFLENASVFNFPLAGESDLLFFSRQIGIDPVTGQEVPVNGGAKITGTLGSFEIGAMDVSTRSSGPKADANYGVLRVKRSLPGGGYIGAMGIDKHSGAPGDPFNQTAGLDTRLVFHRSLVLGAYAVESRTPGLSGDQNDIGGSINYRSNWVDFYAERRDIGRNFNPEVGFLERTDCVCDYLDANFKRRPEWRGVRELNFEGFIFHAPDTRGVMQTQQWQGTFRITFNNGSFSDDDYLDVYTQRLTEPFNIYKNVSIPTGLYHWTRHQLNYASAEDRRWQLRFLERFGGYYNGHLNEARIRGSYRRNPRLSFSWSEQWNRFRLPIAGGNFSVVFGSLETDYAFSRFLLLSTILQMDTANNQGASANIRLRWNYRPDSDLYVIYTAGQRFASLVTDNPPQFTENRFAVKWTYSWSP